MQAVETLGAQQCRAGRALLDWSRDQLAEAAEVGLRTLVDFERGARRPQAETLRRLRQALEKAGVEIIDPNGGGPGVRLRAAPKKAAGRPRAARSRKRRTDR